MNKFKIKLATILLGAMLLAPGIAMVSDAMNNEAVDNSANTTEVAFGLNMGNGGPTGPSESGNGGARSW